MKKIVSFITVLALLFSLTATVFANNGNGDENKEKKNKYETIEVYDANGDKIVDIEKYIKEQKRVEKEKKKKERKEKAYKKYTT